MDYSPDEPQERTLARVIALAFGGDEARYREWLDIISAVCPEDGSLILRGSAVTGQRWEDGQPFDADGPGTSDLDVTFVGGGMIHRWDEFYIPGLHTVPLSDEHPRACLEFVELRSQLCRIAGRPVNIQATTSLVQFARDVTMDQPWLELIANREKQREAGAGTDAATAPGEGREAGGA